MVDPLSIIGAIDASSSLFKSAVQSAKAAYDLMSRYRDYPETVKHLKTEVHGTMIVLQRVQNVSLDDDVLAEIEPILKGCHVACSGLQQVIMKCTARNGGNEPSFQDWARMEFLGGTIGDLKETLKGYKGTIAIIISTISIGVGQMTAGQLANYQRAIMETNVRLADQLRSVSQRPTKPREEQEKIKEVEDAILRCIETCQKAGSTIERIRLESFDIGTRPGKSLTSCKIWQMTDEDLNYVRKYLSASELKLLEIKERGLEDAHQMGNQECLFDQINDHCRFVLHKKEAEVQRERTLRFENIASKDQSFQVIRSMPESSLSAKDITAETKSCQILGDNPNSTIEKSIENYGAARRDNSPRRSRNFFGFFRKSNRKALSHS
ncbi:hypothetical protein BDV06DRAFT_205234 [Aspergillus oleicola]